MNTNRLDKVIAASERVTSLRQRLAVAERELAELLSGAAPARATSKNRRRGLNGADIMAAIAGGTNRLCDIARVTGIQYGRAGAAAAHLARVGKLVRTGAGHYALPAPAVTEANGAATPAGILVE